MDRVLLVIFYLGVPLLLTLMKRRFTVIDKIGVVTLSYIAGIILGNLPGVGFDSQFTHELLGPVIMLAIPLLLFSTRISMFKTAGPVILKSFALCIVAVMTVSTVATWYFASDHPDAWQLGAMTFGVYTGGTVNLSAIGLAIDADENTITLVNAADVLLGGLLLLFLLTVGKNILGKILPVGGDKTESEDDTQYSELEGKIEPRGGLLSFLLAALIVVAGIGISTLLTGGVSELVMYLTVTTFGIGASLSNRIRSLKGSYPLGDYFINTFCVMIGSLADVEVLIQQGGVIIGFVGVVMFGSMVIHFVLARLFRLELGPVVVASTAGLYGPPFIPPIARSFDVPGLIPIGITMSLIGFAVGNYGGIALGQLFVRVFG